MAYRNNVNTFETLKNSARSADEQDTLPESLENCGHGNHKNYFQGILTHTNKNNKMEKYLSIGYQHTITEEQCKKILTAANTNVKSHKKDVASERGQGIDELFLKFGKKITILTYNDTNQTYINYEWLLEKQDLAVTKILNSGRDDEINLIGKDYVNIQSNCDEEDLNSKTRYLENCMKKACKEYNIDYPKTMFFILLLDEYQKPIMENSNTFEINNIEDKCKEIFSKKYARLGINIYFLKEDPNNREKISISKLKKKDITGYDNKQDTIQFQVKIYKKSNDVLIKVINKDKSYFFSFPGNGIKTPPLNALCDKDGNVLKDLTDKYKEKINNWTDNDISFTVEYYCIRYDPKKDIKEFNNKTYAGIYVFLRMINTKGYMLLNDIPFKVEETFRNSTGSGFKNIQHTGGSLFRCVIKVNDKFDVINPETRRRQTKLKPYAKTIIGGLHTVIHRQYYKNVWWKNGKLCTSKRKADTFVDSDMVINILFTDTEQRQRTEKYFKNTYNNESEDSLNSKIKPKSVKKPSNKKIKKTKDTFGSWYAKLYKKEEFDIGGDSDQVVVNFTIKQGTCFTKRKNNRSQENNNRFKKEGFICISEIYINYLKDNFNEKLEHMVKKFWEKQKNYYPKTIKNQETDQCRIYEYKHWLEFKVMMNNIENMKHNLEISSDYEYENEFNKLIN